MISSRYSMATFLLKYFFSDSQRGDGCIDFTTCVLFIYFSFVFRFISRNDGSTIYFYIPNMTTPRQHDFIGAYLKLTIYSVKLSRKYDPKSRTI